MTTSRALGIMAVVFQCAALIFVVLFVASLGDRAFGYLFVMFECFTAMLLACRGIDR